MTRSRPKSPASTDELVEDLAKLLPRRVILLARLLSRASSAARVGIGPTGHGGFGLTVALDLHAPHLERGDAEELMARAHERCPYSNATRDNVDVTLTVDGKALERSVA